jgi:hypothetical protein
MDTGAVWPFDVHLCGSAVLRFGPPLVAFHVAIDHGGLFLECTVLLLGARNGVPYYIILTGR